MTSLTCIEAGYEKEMMITFKETQPKIYQQLSDKKTRRMLEQKWNAIQHKLNPTEFILIQLKVCNWFAQLLETAQQAEDAGVQGVVNFMNQQKHFLVKKFLPLVFLIKPNYL